MNQPYAAGRRLAERHLESGALEPATELVNLAESARADDWTFRSALVRFAQPEPARVAAVMELIRRSEAALHPLQRALAARPACCDRGLSLAAVVADGPEWALSEATKPYVDGRIVDLARLAGPDGAASPEGAAVVQGYQSISPLDEAELAALPLVAALRILDRLGDTLAQWVPTAPAPAPIDECDAACDELQRRFEHLGVPIESGPPGPGRSRRR